VNCSTVAPLPDCLRECRLLNGLETVRLTASSRIRGDGVETRLGECNELVPHEYHDSGNP